MIDWKMAVTIKIGWVALHGAEGVLNSGDGGTLPAAWHVRSAALVQNPPLLATDQLSR
jgi:hypothetical protein